MQVTKVSPLKKEVIDEKLEKAESKRLEQLANLKLKSQKLAKHETYTEKEPEDVKKERIISSQTERIKSAEKKRSSFLEEKIEKSKKEFEKIEVLKKEKEIKQKTELLERLETKLRKGQENHAKVEDNNLEKF